MINNNGFLCSIQLLQSIVLLFLWRENSSKKKIENSVLYTISEHKTAHILTIDCVEIC